MAELGLILNKAVDDFKAFEGKSRETHDALEAIRVTLSNAVGVAERMERELEDSTSNLNKITKNIDTGKVALIELARSYEKTKDDLKNTQAEIVKNEARIEQLKKLADDYKKQAATL